MDTIPKVNLESHSQVASNPLRCIRSSKNLTLAGSWHYIAFIDDFTRLCWIVFLKFKSEVVGVFWKFKKMVENQSGCKIQVLRSNNGKKNTPQKNLICFAR